MSRQRQNQIQITISLKGRDAEMFKRFQRENYMYKLSEAGRALLLRELYRIMDERTTEERAA
jgi:hypothetical protein